ncbi:MAG: conjugative transposon protein TraN [Rikenellaceae bacterium]
MKKIFLAALMGGTYIAQAQQSQPISEDRIIIPHVLEVAFDKTTHILFPDAVTYVDLGSANIIAGKADGAENVVRVKSASNGFTDNTNMSVITDNGNFYTFEVRYDNHPRTLNVEMVDFIHDGNSVNRPNNALDIYLKNLGKDSPRTVQVVMKSIYDDNKYRIRDIGDHNIRIEYLLKSIYTHDGLIYLHTELSNNSHIPFDVDFVTMKIVDKRVAKRTAMQEQIITPLRAYNYITRVNGRKSERTVFALERFTIPDNKQLIIELHEKNGGRHQSFRVKGKELLKAETITKLKKR